MPEYGFKKFIGKKKKKKQKQNVMLYTITRNYAEEKKIFT